MNCKQGDLAFVVKAESTPEIIGRIVEVKRPYVKGEVVSGLKVSNKYGAVWICSLASGEKIAWRDCGGGLRFVRERPIADCLLIPIRPGELDETTDTDLKLKEPA